MRRLAYAALLLAACRGDMANQPRYKPLAASGFFRDGAAARRAPPGTVPAGMPAVTAPVRIDAQLLARGQERFDIYCAPCHGLAGDGAGIITRHGLASPPSFHLARLRAAPAAHFFDVVTHGYGAMFSYADRLAPADRWAVVAYIRALQLSRSAPVALLTAPERRRLEALP